jgi:hypothetical protein
VADFYWSEALAAFRALVKDPELARKAVDLADPAEADRLLRTLVDEVFIDTHCGFFNGRVATPGVKTLDDRAFDHIRLIEKWVATGCTGIDQAGWAEMQGAALELRLEVARNSKRWADGAKALEQLRRLFPTRRELQDRTVGFEIQRGFEGLSNREGKGSYLADAGSLKKAITRLDAFRVDYPLNLRAFEALGHLHQVRAIKLANAGRASEALVEAQRALDHWPGLDGAEKTRADIADLLQKMILRAAEIRAMVARTPNARLNVDGQSLCAEADRGFKPHRVYVGSAEPARVAATRERAHNRDIWLRAGLDEPIDRFDERAAALVQSLTAAIDMKPRDQADATRLWRKAAAGVPELAEVDGEKAGRFLGACLFDRQEKPEAPTSAAPADPAAAGAPSLPSAPVGSRRGEEPMEFWLFGPRGRVLKGFAAAAVLLLLVGSAMAIARSHRDQARDGAFAGAVAARANRDHIGVVRAAEAFLGNPPLRGTDSRVAEVRTLYDEAMLHWFISLENREDPEAKQHVDAYRRLAAPRPGGRRG